MSLDKGCQAKKVSSFEAQIIILNPPGKGGIKPGYNPVVDVHSTTVNCQMSSIKSIIDRKTRKVINDKPTELKMNDCAIIEMIP